MADSSPLVAAANARERSHSFASRIVNALGRELLVLPSVVTEVDYLARRRMSAAAGRGVLRAIADGEHTAVFLTPGLLARAVEIDATYADLNLGFVDASVMAYAERHELPILTFDFRHFRATRPARGEWRLLVDERTLARAV